MPLIRSVLLLIALIAPAFGQDGPKLSASAKDAVPALRLYLDEVTKSGGRPDYIKPPASDLFHRVFDLEQLTALPPCKAGDLPWLLDWLGAANQTNKLIMYFGAKPGPDFDQVAALRNLTEYQDQYAAATNFLLRFTAREAPALNLFMDQLSPEQRTPIREAGLRKARGGAAEQVFGSISTVADKVIKPANARLITAAMRDNADFRASFILPDDRTQIIGLLAKATKMVGDEEARNNLTAFAATLAAAK
ncbi:hypothetical protein SAMN05444159_0279 [Bradyrhizobium lablabi]|uniref:DUF2059 domain-containing protein n=1 Tax=Bradyrhizobium lablabi TaxID=722472 RepID=A0A1M6IAF3_9BRAD|nr:hypothetical protein [Bradyrhizobium lablabi]SHJ31393.1 hypothetical protein SAMN05444159_0279 [Bradyrhizobium lablabi]